MFFGKKSVSLMFFAEEDFTETLKANDLLYYYTFDFLIKEDFFFWGGGCKKLTCFFFCFLLYREVCFVKRFCGELSLSLCFYQYQLETRSYQQRCSHVSVILRLYSDSVHGLGGSLCGQRGYSTYIEHLGQIL